MLDSSYPKEGEVIGWVKVPHSGAGLGRQLVNQSCILHCSRIVQGATNGDACIEKKGQRNIHQVIQSLDTERAHLTYTSSITNGPISLQARPFPFLSTNCFQYQSFLHIETLEAIDAEEESLLKTEKAWLARLIASEQFG